MMGGVDGSNSMMVVPIGTMFVKHKYTWNTFILVVGVYTPQTGV